MSSSEAATPSPTDTVATNSEATTCGPSASTASSDVVVITNIAQGVITTTEDDNAAAEDYDVEAALSSQQQLQVHPGVVGRQEFTTSSPGHHDDTLQSSSLSNHPTTTMAGPPGGLSNRRRSFKERFLLPTTHTENSPNNNNYNIGNCNHQQPTPITITSSSPSPPATKAPKDTLRAVYAAGKYKAGLRYDVLMIQSTMAGIFIAFAGQLFLSVGGGVLGAALFPGGLLAVILTSAELFTGDALIFVASVLGKQVPLSKLLRNWTVSWCGNFVGSLLWAFFLGYLSSAVQDANATELAISVAEKKALDDLGSIFLKGVGANFLVCVAVWQGTTAEEVAGKILALWWPTASFILLGFSHCVANMYLIPMGMMLGANISVGRMFASLFMATLGNVVGGGIFVGAVYWYVFDSMASFGGLTARIRHNMRINAVTRALHHAGTGSNHPVNNAASNHHTKSATQNKMEHHAEQDLDV